MNAIKFKELVQITPVIHIARFYKPQGFVYTPSQFLTITIQVEGEELYRCYSISSHPDEEYIEFTIKFSDTSKARGFLHNAKDGQEILYVGPTGKYFYKDNEMEKVHIVTGAGIGPNFSMLKEWEKQGQKQKTYLFFGMSYFKYIPYIEHFKKWEGKGNFKLYPCLTKEKCDEKSTFKGRVLEVFGREMPNLDNKEFYICGKPEMVKEAITLLKSKDIEKEKLHFEEFTKAYI